MRFVLETDIWNYKKRGENAYKAKKMQCPHLLHWYKALHLAPDKKDMVIALIYAPSAPRKQFSMRIFKYFILKERFMSIFRSMTVFLVNGDDMMPTHKTILSKKNHFFPDFVAENQKKFPIYKAWKQRKFS